MTATTTPEMHPSGRPAPGSGRDVDKYAWALRTGAADRERGAPAFLRVIMSSSLGAHCCSDSTARTAIDQRYAFVHTMCVRAASGLK